MTTYTGSTPQSRALAWAEGQVGTVETGNNIVTYWDQVNPAYQGQPWCAGFVVAAYLAQGVDLRPLIDSPYYCPSWVSYAKRIGAWKTAAALPGDLVLYDWGRDGIADHVGIAWPDYSSSLYRAVEGNTSPTSAGPQSNGGGVWVRYRPRTAIAGWVDMATVLTHLKAQGRYVEATATPTESITTAPQEDAVYLIKLKGAPEVYLSDGIAARHMPDPASLADLAELARNGLLTLRTPAPGTPDVIDYDGVLVREVTNPALIGHIA